MDNFKISIVLPIYNLEIELIKKCIDTIITQQYNNWECILVDDGSTEPYKYDDYYRTLTTDNRFKYYYKSNEGLAMTRNFGFNKSTGDLIWFIDPDDYIVEKYSFDYLVNIFRKYNDIDFINFAFFSTIYKPSLSVSEGVYLNDDNFPLEYNWHTVWRNIYKREFLINNNIYHQNKRVLFEDIYFDLLVKDNFKKMYYTNKQLYFYNNKRVNSICNTSNDVISKINCFVNNIDECFEYIKKNNKNIDTFTHHLFYFYPYFPFLKSELKKLIYKKAKTTKKIKFKAKLAIFISKNIILIFLYKIYCIVFTYVKRVLF